MILMRLLRSVCYLLLGAIYVLAAWGKLHQPKKFFRAVAEYELVPDGLLPWVASTLPAIEMLAGVLMLLGAVAALGRRRTRMDSYAEGSAWIAAGLLVVFIAALSHVIMKGMSLDCGCFDVLGQYIPGMAAKKITWGTVWRDVAMLALAVPILGWRK